MRWRILIIYFYEGLISNILRASSVPWGLFKWMSYLAFILLYYVVILNAVTSFAILLFLCVAEHVFVPFLMLLIWNAHFVVLIPERDFIFDYLMFTIKSVLKLRTPRYIKHSSPNWWLKYPNFCCCCCYTHCYGFSAGIRLSTL